MFKFMFFNNLNKAIVRYTCPPSSKNKKNHKNMIRTPKTWFSLEVVFNSLRHNQTNFNVLPFFMWRFLYNLSQKSCCVCENKSTNENVHVSYNILSLNMFVIQFLTCLSASIFQLFGGSATTPSTTAACPSGWSRTTVAPSANKTGWCRESANEDWARVFFRAVPAFSCAVFLLAIACFL